MKEGFTTIELVVAISLITIMTSALMLSWNPAEKTLTLKQTSHQISQDVRRAAQLSLSAASSSCPTFYEDYYGFGLQATANSGTYIIYENCNQNYVWDAASDDTLIQEVSINEDLEISSVTPSSPLNILFVPPEPQVFINNSTTSDAIITTKIINDSTTHQIQINSRGGLQVNQ